MSEFKELIEGVRKLEGGADLADKLILAKTDVNNEAKGYREDLKAVTEQFGEFKTILTSLNIKEPKELKETLSGSDLTIKRLEEQMATLLTNADENNKKNLALETQAKTAELKNLITKIASGQGSEGSQLEDAYGLSKDRYEMDSTGKYVNKDNGKELEADLTSFLQDRSYLLANPVKSGAGSEKGSRQGASKTYSEMSNSELNALFKENPAEYTALLSKRDADLKANSNIITM